MTHDPLCPLTLPCNCFGDDGPQHPEGDAVTYCDYCGRECQCDLIAQVVKREQEKASKVTAGGTFGPGVDGITDADITAFLSSL
jgi:hypothetical protein